MLKKLTAAIFLILPMQAFSSSAEISSLGPPVPFFEPFTVNVNVIEKVSGLVYWAEPISTDAAGISAVKKYIESSKTNNYMPSPFVFQFRLAGVVKEDDSGADLTNDDFSITTNKAINTALEGKSFTLKCYGQYQNTIVPYCDVIGAQGASPVYTLVNEGLLIPEPLAGVTDGSQQKALKQSMDSAKERQVGVWKPFHSMFRGLQ